MVFCGFIKLNIYYSAFQIHIADYLEFTEIISSFASDIILYSLMVLFGYFFSFLLTTKERANHQVARRITSDSLTYYVGIQNIVAIKDIGNYCAEEVVKILKKTSNKWLCKTKLTTLILPVTFKMEYIDIGRPR